MKKLNVVFNGCLAMGLCVMMMGCGSASERYLNKYENFVTSLSEGANEMSAEDWAEAQKKQDEFMLTYQMDFMDVFTSEENQRFGGLQAEYAKVAIGKAFENIDNSLQKGVEVMDGFVDGLMEDE